MFKDSLDNLLRPCLKTKNDQACKLIVECLSSLCKALSSILSFGGKEEEEGEEAEEKRKEGEGEAEGSGAEEEAKEEEEVEEKEEEEEEPSFWETGSLRKVLS